MTSIGLGSRLLMGDHLSGAFDAEASLDDQDVHPGP